MKIYIKNMVCNRCIMAVEAEFEKLGIHPATVELGKVELLEDWNENNKMLLCQRLNELGFEIVEDKTRIIIERIKSQIITLVHHQDLELKINLSAYLSQNLSLDYNTLSSLFSETEAETIEHFFIKQKIEKVKELLTYNELSLSEIAYKMNYSDVAHLSNQFKKITGITPTKFKLLDKNERTQIDYL